jgi:glycosyltransferase involved in cell wall biosynthesis
MQSVVRHLPSFGWAPLVITRDRRDLDSFDLRELARLPVDLKVVEVVDPDPFAVRARRMQSAASAEAGAGMVAGAVPPSGPAPPGSPSKHSLGARLRRLPLIMASAVLKALLRQVVYRPDALRLWAGAVARVALRDNSVRADALLTSSPAFSCHLAGLAIKRRTGVPWVADFRDLWVGRPFREEGSALRRWFDARQEAAVVLHCDRLVLASPAWVPVFVKRYGAAIERKLVVITNGYESVLMDQARARAAAATLPRQPGRVRFVLTGSMHEGESPLPLLQALAALRAANPALADRAELIFIGSAGGHAEALQQAVSAGGLEGQVTFLPPQANDLCLEAQCAADWLMLFSALPHRDTLRGKSFEYMATGKPILACIPTLGVQAEVERRWWCRMATSPPRRQCWQRY